MIYYASPTRLIGRHHWRMVVENSRYGGRCTDWQWQRMGCEDWHPSKEWPRYNADDTYDGLPRSLQPFYDTFSHAALAMLAGFHPLYPSQPVQASLF